MMSPQPDPDLIKDDDTVVTTENNVEGQQPVANSRNKQLIVFSILCFGILAGILSVVFVSDPVPLATPLVPPASTAVLEYELIETLTPAGPVGLFSTPSKDEVGYIDTETGCLNIVKFEDNDLMGSETDEFVEPLCSEFLDVRSVTLRGDEAIVASGGRIKLYTFGSDVWFQQPGGEKSITMIHAPGDSPNFGKKVAYFGTMTQLIVADDENVYLYRWIQGRKWVQDTSWTAIGFAVDPEETTLAVYDSKKVMVFDLTPQNWYMRLDEPTIYKSSAPISTVVVSNSGIHIVSQPSDGSVITNAVTKSSFKVANFATKVVGDAIYSIGSGCLVDITTGEYFQISVDDADNVFDVQVSKRRIVVQLERNGVKMVDIYEK
jgi:hypothetical protein